MSIKLHLQSQIEASATRVTVETQHGPVKGGRASNGTAVFLEVPYALYTGRFNAASPLPADFKYEDNEYIYERNYCAQPKLDGAAAIIPVEDRLGFGKQTENPLFVNVICPPSFPSKASFPVKVYVHGGFLQVGSPHGLFELPHYVAADREEVWVTIGYRLNVFGFLASDVPKLDGNFGFLDQWLALLWIRDHIKAFGGNPEDIQLTGLSAGAHSVHQILHHVSHLPEGEQSPFQSAILQSNAIVIAPKTPAEQRAQFQAFCRALKLDPDAEDILDILRDPQRVPTSAIIKVIETGAAGPQHSTFRGCLDGTWLPVSPDPLEWQRSGGFARSLRDKGVRGIVVGDLVDEWFVYSTVHPIGTARDVEVNLERYFTPAVVERIVGNYRQVMYDATSREELVEVFGEIMANGQVHIPVRMLARDLLQAGFPVIRYEIGWTPEQIRPGGYVTHGTDRPLWSLMLPYLDQPGQVDIARAWQDAVASEVKAAVEGTAPSRGVREVLALQKNKTIGWKTDEKWDDIMGLEDAFSGSG